MTGSPRDVGPIEGREVRRARDDDATGWDPPTPPPASSPPPPTPPATPPHGWPDAPAPSSPAAPDPVATDAGSGTDHDGRSGSRLPVLRPQTQAAFAQAMYDIRHSRGKDVPNSRPLPDWVQRLAWVLDSAFGVPGTNGRRVGVDGIIAIVPVLGDAVGVGLSLAVVLAGVAAGVSIPTLLRMLLNVGLEALVGLIPFGGTLFDMVFKANIRNVVLMERDLADRRTTRRSSIAVLVLSLLVVLVGIAMVVLLWVLTIALLVWLVAKIF